MSDAAIDTVMRVCVCLFVFVFALALGLQVCLSCTSQATVVADFVAAST